MLSPGSASSLLSGDDPQPSDFLSSAQQLSLCGQGLEYFLCAFPSARSSFLTDGEVAFIQHRIKSRPRVLGKT